MSTAKQIADYLVLNTVGAFGGSADWSINVGAEPGLPDNCITIYDTGGQEPDTDEVDLLRPSFQVRVRCRSYLEGISKQGVIRDLLSTPATTLISGYIALWLTSDVQSIGRDDNGRHILVANYRAIKER